MIRTSSSAGQRQDNEIWTRSTGGSCLYRWYSKNKTRIEERARMGILEHQSMVLGSSGSGASSGASCVIPATGGCHGSPPARKHRILKAAVSCHLHSLLEQQACSTQVGENHLTKWHPFHPLIAPYFNRTSSSYTSIERINLPSVCPNRTAPSVPASHLQLERR